MFIIETGITLLNKVGFEKCILFTNTDQIVPLGGAICDKNGTITIWKKDEIPPPRTGRDNDHHFPIKGIEDRLVTIEGTEVYRIPNETWYDWGFHKEGMWICFENELFVIILPQQLKT